VLVIDDAQAERPSAATPSKAAAANFLRRI